MLEAYIRHLVEHDLTSVNEIEEITGRGTSTVYRWISGESEPHYGDVRALVRGLAKPEARRTLVGLLASDLPVIVTWLSADAPAPELETELQGAGHDALEKALLALDYITDGLAQGHQAIRQQALPADRYTRLVELIDHAIHNLTTSKNLLKKYVNHGGPKES